MNIKRTTLPYIEYTEIFARIVLLLLILMLLFVVVIALVIVVLVIGQLWSIPRRAKINFVLAAIVTYFSL